jgi:hypothetical protein
VVKRGAISNMTEFSSGLCFIRIAISVHSELLISDVWSEFELFILHELHQSLIHREHDCIDNEGACQGRIHALEKDPRPFFDPC